MDETTRPSEALNTFLNALPGVNTWAMRKGYLEAGIRDPDRGAGGSSREPVSP
ncbi:hypothetical protein [Rhodococcus aetherivorans]|uniref:hypothetical protein n=1 Tax=Rhodococcus aetherivorans TaxID=191292 RepID=UPI001E39F383|nr:hypothetical protein [Rhodococcus aetherivorans]UGQ39953.1 hypothetical protein LRQ66_17395 [Rhodococcus aetherivorans]